MNELPLSMISLRTFIVLLLCCSAYSLQAQEVALFGRDGKAVAYIAEDRDRTVYLWSGDAVAYLEPSAGLYDIWGFNGRHLGWLVNGTVYDDDGLQVGVTKRAANFFTEWEPYKPFKKAKPLKGIRRYMPYTPYWSLGWSDIRLADLLGYGISE